jgi:hypothetical protein
MPAKDTVQREPCRRPCKTALQARVEYETAHPEIAITAPLESVSGRWEVSQADGSIATFGEVWAMLDFLASLFGATGND